LNIALDATYSGGPYLSGVGVYSREILYGLARLRAGQTFSWAYRPHALSASFKQSLPPNVHRAWLGKRRTWPWPADLFHGLNQRADARMCRRVVATFHDLFVLTGEYSSPEFRERFAGQARRAAENADLIIAVSEFTAGQVSSLLAVERSRIRIIHHGARVPSEPPVEDGAKENLILHVGAIQTRKNVARLIDAFESTPEGWRMALAGSQGYGAGGIMARLERSPRRRDIDLLGYVTDAALEGLYRRARVLAFPSLDEGFGMPVIDAMARGVPVLTSEGSALEEIAGGAALLVDPRDSDALTAGLSRLARDADLRRELRRKGFERARKFSWEKAVERTWRVYEELL
jgi:O-antigen biosynthesis alpha-1,2-mannosyltransferase